MDGGHHHLTGPFVQARSANLMTRRQQNLEWRHGFVIFGKITGNHQILVILVSRLFY